LETARWDFRGNLLHVLLTGEETGGAFGLIEITEWPGAVPPRHVHRGFDEVITVLAGELTFEMAGERFAAPAGSVVFVPRGTEHGFAVESERVRFQVLFLPGGAEGGFVESSQPAESLTVPARWAGEADLARLADLAEKYDTTVTGPPIERRGDANGG
jgi:quercetin dioxygenase-like cupin family protein